MTAISLSAVLTILLATDARAQARPELPSTVRLSPIIDPAAKSDTVRQIKVDLGRSDPDAKLVACPTLIDYVEQASAGHDTSFGAVCTIRVEGKPRQVTLCDDRMVGRFFETDGAINDPEQIGLFVRTHCPPGG